MKGLLSILREELPEAKPIVTEGGTSDVDQSTLRGDLDLIRKAVAATPNTSEHFPTRESYRDFGYAIKAALPDHPHEAFEIYAEWCSRWTDGHNSPDVVEADWRRMKPPFRRGAAYVYELADQYSGGRFSKAEQWFQPVKDYEPLFPEDVAKNDTLSPDAKIKWIKPSEWNGKEPAPREWEVLNWIPKGEVTLLYGDGGIGKTLLAHQYATAAAAGLDWLGQPTRQARVMCFFCEDSEDELHRRQLDINASMGVTFEDLDENLRIASRKYMDNLFILWDKNTGAMKRQAVWDQLLQDARDFKAEVLIVDTIADTYGGSEIDRGQVNAFVKSCLGRLASELGGSVIALGHPSQSGKASGQGTSGSTAWSNAARSRLFLRYPKGVEKGDIRELEGMKLNYGPKGSLLKLQWKRGAFQVLAGTTPPVSENLAKPFEGSSASAPLVASLDDAVEQAVVAAILSAPSAALSLSQRSQHYAPRVLKRQEPELFAAYTGEEIEAAMLRLERKGAIVAGEVGRKENRHPVQGYVVVQDKLSDSGASDGGVFD